MSVVTDDDLPARAARRGLSVEAYLNDLEASRRWKRANRAQARTHDYSRCTCGNPKARQSPRCIECHRWEQSERLQEKRSDIAACWAQGMTLREIGAALHFAPEHVGVEMVRMRKDGWDLPYRRPRNPDTLSRPTDSPN